MYFKNNKLELPSPPELLIELRRLASDPDTETNDITDLIKHDVNISGRLIKIANCALFASKNKVGTVQAAVMRLGLKKVQSLVTGLVIGQQIMRNKTKGLEAFCQQGWQTSNDVAALSYVIAQKKTKLDPEQALLSGIVHNIGALPLVLKLNTIQALKDDPKIMTMVADVVIPKLYPKAGQLIMQSWHFSPEITVVSKEHLNLARVGTEHIELADITLVAHQLNQLSEFDNVNTPEQLASSPAFKKLWPDWPTACIELKDWDEEIKQMKSDMTS
ncbi:MAG: HDOD domain-containing protein [Piscirickettsiaceae bacterium]|jgi:HD-like signal output (HDOD) protein|nr:HDOD domain-containing protein [Piscirickettsiaceae bacterium]